jgi:DNA polymerase III delta prime subunit
MVSFIIVAKEKKKREGYIADYASQQKIDPLDITVIDKSTSIKTTQSIGIETVKLIQQKLFFKPFKSSSKIVVIEDAQLLTPEAQNALLKILEEPPANTFIFLGTETRELLLPTIISRCQIIELKEEQKTLSDKTRGELNNFIESLPELSIGEKLKDAEQLAKDKEKAVKWIENLIIVLREEMLQAYSINQQSETRNPPLTTIKAFQSLHTLLKTTNVNPRFAIESTLLNM